VLMRSARIRPRDRTPVGVDVAAGAVLVVAAAVVAGVVPAVDGSARLAVLALAVGVFAAWSVDAVAVAAVTLLAWLVDNGFLVDRLGQLGWHGWPDAYRIAALVLAGGLGWSFGAVAGRVRRVRGAGDIQEGEGRRDG
jgi:hypothetical protein